MPERGGAPTPHDFSLGRLRDDVPSAWLPEPPAAAASPDEEDATPAPPLAERVAGPFPVAPRVLSAAVGLLLLGFVWLRVPDLVAQGFPLSAYAAPLVTLPFAFAFVVLALKPAWVQRTFGKRSPLDLRRPRHVFAVGFLTLVLYLVIGVNSLLAGVFAYEDVFVNERGADAFDTIEPGVLAVSIVGNVLLLVMPPLVWLALVHDLPMGRGLRRLGVKSEGALRAAAAGVAFAVGVILLLAIASAALTYSGATIPENEQAQAIAESVDPLGALALSAGAGVTEEIFFRGFLMPRIGMWPQALVFALAHLSYVNVLQTVVTFALALGFGWLYQRTGNLWAPIVAHFSFNAIMLLSASYAT